MDLDHDACYRAISTRDARFDGQLFVGVKTTGIYCRPICPARTPKSENVVFYPTAAAAQAAGFRPCLRCRPETSPDLAAWRGTSNTVSRALALIETGALDAADVEGLAGRLGVGERQLRRLFRRHLGASPV
ncbi:MAG: Ada metal-binding domain-containing protein, partial [Methylocella sp.]